MILTCTDYLFIHLFFQTAKLVAAATAAEKFSKILYSIKTRKSKSEFMNKKNFLDDNQHAINNQIQGTALGSQNEQMEREVYTYYCVYHYIAFAAVAWSGRKEITQIISAFYARNNNKKKKNTRNEVFVQRRKLLEIPPGKFFNSFTDKLPLYRMLESLQFKNSIIIEKILFSNNYNHDLILN